MGWSEFATLTARFRLPIPRITRTWAQARRGLPREEAGAEKPPARVCEGKAEWLSYSTTIIRLGHVDWRHGRGQPRHKAILVPAACCQHYCKRQKNDQKSTHSEEFPANSIAIMKRLTPDALALSPRHRECT